MTKDIDRAFDWIVAAEEWEKQNPFARAGKAYAEAKARAARNAPSDPPSREPKRVSQPPRPKPVKAPHNQGGRPPDVEKSVKEWFDKLKPEEQSRGAGKLAGSYKIETPPRPGSSDHVRKIITKLQREAGENPVKT
jgi:hypothetical protein